MKLNEECSTILQNKLPPKLKDPWSFSIPCTKGNIYFNQALCDLGPSANLMPYSILEKFALHELTPTIITLRLAGRSIKNPRGIVEDVLVKVDKFIILLISLYMEEDKNVSLILGRSFLATSRAFIDVQKYQLTLRVNDEHIVFNVFRPMKHLYKKEHDIFAIDSINTTRTDNVHLVKFDDPKDDCTKNFNGDNLQDMKEMHKEVPRFVDTGQEVKSKLQKVVLLNGSTFNQKVKPPVEASSDRKKAIQIRALTLLTLVQAFLPLCSSISSRSTTMKPSSPVIAEVAVARHASFSQPHSCRASSSSTSHHHRQFRRLQHLRNRAPPPGSPTLLFLEIFFFSPTKTCFYSFKSLMDTPGPSRSQCRIRKTKVTLSTESDLGGNLHLCSRHHQDCERQLT
ncbi:UNVERIFIED_CONTAM: hypothetical protein Sangu_1310300 [Sesamum angustifolium]|uniref:Uncharacterized protein n=1 Tax=Sesamum angustifolium TaxID=2727405 RepID=A0AAW2NNM2_9LAMI